MTNGKVYFIGAGPGDPDLITVKGAKILSHLEVIIVDRLVSAAILEQYAQASAKIISVGKQGHHCSSPTQSEVNEILVSAAKEYECVGRLKGGDIAFFSNIMDELIALKKNHITYEIIPGVTAASAASAFTGVPLTARGYATGVQFLSLCGHMKISDEEWKYLAEMRNTMVWYMTSKEWPNVARKLALAGIDIKTPLLVIEQASTPQQFVHELTIEESINQNNPIDFISPSIIIVGKVSSLYPQFAWYHNLSERLNHFLPVHSKYP